MANKLRKAGWAVTAPENNLIDMDEAFLEAWGRAKPYTLISVERAWAFVEAVRYVERAGIPGDIVECGVWKGGACLLSSFFLGDQRQIWLYDTFCGMNAPGSEDRIAVSNQSLTERNPEGWWSSGIREVQKTLEKSPLPEDRFTLVQGPVEETLDSVVPDSIAVLRLDTDWYESTRKELEVLYPRLSSGAVLIIDDYGHFTGARKAVDEYFKKRGEAVLLHRSDYTGRVLVKQL